MACSTAWLLAAALLGSGVQGSKPEDCTAEASEGGAYELLAVVENCTVYLGIVASDRTDVTDEKFEHWEGLENRWSKNPSGVRYTTMARSCLYGSPGNPQQYVHNIDVGEPWSPPIPWMYLAQTCAHDTVLGGCFPAECRQDTNAQDGSLKYYEINKCHKMEWDAGDKISKIVDPDGNEYIMHACSDAAAAASGKAFGSPLLPEGWNRYDEVVLAEPLVLIPDTPDSTAKEPTAGARLPFGSFSCGFALIQDSMGNGYHRFKTTTGNANVKGQLNLLLRGNTPPELVAAITTGIVVLAVLIIGGGVYCYKSRKADAQVEEKGVELS